MCICDFYSDDTALEQFDHFASKSAVIRKKEHDCILEVRLEAYHLLGTSRTERLGFNEYYDGTEPSKADLDAYCKKVSALSGKKASIS